MKDEILTQQNNPAELEKLYRVNKAEFKREFLSLYPQLQGSVLAAFWHARLTQESSAINWGSKNDLWFILILGLIAGFLAKLPALFSIPEEYFYPRNIGFLVFPFLAVYFARHNKLSVSKTMWLAGAFFVCIIYINLLPGQSDSDTLILACLHLPLLLWALLGISFTGNNIGNYRNRLSYLRFNGDLLVMTALLMIACGILSGITIGLFSLIGLHIEAFYAKYIVAVVLPSVPLVATFLTQTNPQLVNKISPVIAKIFSPVVLVMLVIYLIAIVYSAKNPFTDRDFLLLFNMLLIGVMALIFFSVAENAAEKSSTATIWVLLLLSVVTVVVNCIALSAISFRISEWGITPNRIAVLGGNVLILVHLLLVAFMLFKAATKKAVLAEVGRTVVVYLPVYILWAMVVVFLFPIIFGFK